MLQKNLLFARTSSTKTINIRFVQWQHLRTNAKNKKKHLRTIGEQYSAIVNF